MSKIPWYVTRASGIVAWALILLSIVWGLLLATKVLGRKPGPAWLLSLHRYLGALAITFVGVHIGTILIDTYTNFGLAEVLIPFTGSWHPIAVAWGIVSMYLLAAIEITSLVRRRLSNQAWRTVHLVSYLLFASVTIHMLAAGTDAKTILGTSAAVLVGAGVTFGALSLYFWRQQPAVDAARPPHAPSMKVHALAVLAVRSGGVLSPEPFTNTGQQRSMTALRRDRGERGVGCRYVPVPVPVGRARTAESRPRPRVTSGRDPACVGVRATVTRRRHAAHQHASTLRKGVPCFSTR